MHHSPATRKARPAWKHFAQRAYLVGVLLFTLCVLCQVFLAGMSLFVSPSWGQVHQRRLALARALLHDPHLLYLDEPTLGVDVQSRRAIWDYILGLHQQGKTVLITINYLEEAQALCDRIAILDHGKLIAVGTPEHLKQTYGGSVVELETAQPSTVVDDIRRLPGVKEVIQEGTKMRVTTQAGSLVVPQMINLVTQDGELRQIATREPTLDEIFLRLMGTALRD